MRRVWITLTLATVVVAPLAAQAADSAPPAAPAGPTPGQQQYLDGLRTTGRGIAQLKDGISRVSRSRADTAQARTAGQRLGGLCGSAGSFMRQGRAKMSHTAYADSARTLARRLNQQIDSVMAFLPACQREGGKKPAETAAELLNRLRGYEGALQRFREWVILPPAPPTPSPED